MNIQNIIFWGIEGERYKPEQEISAEMLAAVAVVVTQIEDYLII